MFEREQQNTLKGCLAASWGEEWLWEKVMVVRMVPRRLCGMTRRGGGLGRVHERRIRRICADEAGKWMHAGLFVWGKKYIQL